MFFNDEDYGVCLQARSLAIARGVSIFQVIKEMGHHDALDRIGRFLKTYMAFKDQAGGEGRLYDFLDMLTEYLDRPRPLSEFGVEVVFLDEAQDLSKLQWNIFRHMIQGVKRVYIAGDDDQSIYNFIGADPNSFNSFPANEIKVLTKSYRVPRAIGHRADKVISPVNGRWEKEVNWKDSPGKLVYGPSDVGKLPVRNKPTLILCRHRRQVLAVSRKLIHIPHAIDHNAIINSNLSRVFSTHMTLLDGGKVPLVVKDENDKVVERPVRDLMRYLKIPWSVDDNKADYGMLDLPAIHGLAPLWRSGRTQAERELFANLSHYWRKGYKFNVPPNLRIMTMHAAKGQEADDVFILTDCNETVYENRYADTERRLMYVALTRAKENCIICQPKSMTYMKGFFQ